MRVDELRAELDQAAGPEPAPSDAFVTDFLRRQATLRSRRSWGVVSVVGALAIAVAVSVLALQPGSSHRSVEAPIGPTTSKRTTPTTLAPRTDIPVAHLELASPVITAGTTVSATVVVENDTGSPITITGCTPGFHALLGNEQYQQSYAVADIFCTTTSTIPLGESRYPVSIDGSYSQCVPVPGGADGIVPCNLTGPPGSNLMPPLPEGEYQLTIEFDRLGALEVPAPTTVVVTTSTCATEGRSVRVPDVRGLGAGDAVSTLGRKHLTVVRASTGGTSPRRRTGKVVEQVPAPHTSVPRSSCVVIRTK